MVTVQTDLYTIVPENGRLVCHRVLIVDDERMAREATFELLSMIDDIEMELLKASAAMEAKKYFIARRVDVVVLDINMPQICFALPWRRLKMRFC